MPRSSLLDSGLQAFQFEMQWMNQPPSTTSPLAIAFMLIDIMTDLHLADVWILFSLFFENIDNFFRNFLLPENRINRCQECKNVLSAKK